MVYTAFVGVADEILTPRFASLSSFQYQEIGGFFTVSNTNALPPGADLESPNAIQDLEIKDIKYEAN